MLLNFLLNKFYFKNTHGIWFIEYVHHCVTGALFMVLSLYKFDDTLISQWHSFNALIVSIILIWYSFAVFVISHRHRHILDVL